MKKVLKFTLYGLLALVILAIVGLKVTGNDHVLSGFTKTYLRGVSTPDIDDMLLFDVSSIPADHPDPWALHKSYNLFQLTPDQLADLDSMQTTAFIVIKGDSIAYEHYWNEGSDTTYSNSFSMAKSFCALLVGIAEKEGYIQSIDDPVFHYLPEFSQGKNAQLTIRHLLQMASGIPFGESYNSPFGFMAKAYYGDDLWKETIQYSVEKDPGTFWAYEGGNTVVLGKIIEVTTKRKVSQYFFEKVWSCIGAEHNAYWNLDHVNGMEKTFSGFYSTARDFARMGLLMKRGGVWGNDTIVPPAFVQMSITPNKVTDENGEACTWYGYHWWLGEVNGHSFYSARGLRGQYIAVIPDLDIVMVRLGHTQNKDRVNHMPPDFIRYLNYTIDYSYNLK